MRTATTNMRYARALLPMIFGFVLIQSANAQTTARADFEDVVAAAAELAGDAELVSIAAETVDPTTGSSAEWFYVMQSEDEDRAFTVVKNGDGISSSSTLVFEHLSSVTDFVSPGAVPENWLDSGSAVALAEGSGGASFREGASDVSVSALLAAVPTTSAIDLGPLPGFNAFWLFSYSSAAHLDAALFIVDAQTGFTVSSFPTTARDELSTAADAAADFSADAQLIGVSTLLPDLRESGGSNLWTYRYYSPSQRRIREVIVGLGGLVFEVDLPQGQPAFEIVGDWIDSDAAAAIAYSDAQPHAATVVNARLDMRTTRKGQRAVWSFRFQSLLGGAEDVVHVDAVTGTLTEVSAVGVASETGVEAALHATYPNPFERATTIAFDVSGPGAVELAVFDLLGRRERRAPDDDDEQKNPDRESHASSSSSSSPHR